MTTPPRGLTNHCEISSDGHGRGSVDLAHVLARVHFLHVSYMEVVGVLALVPAHRDAIVASDDMVGDREDSRVLVVNPRHLQIMKGARN